MIGYKVMGLSEDGKFFISGANSTLNLPAKLGKVSMPGNGIYMGNNKKYVLDYYSGLNDKEALITFEFNESDIIFGNTTDIEAEFSVPNAKIIDIKLLEETDEFDTKLISSTKVGEVSFCSSYLEGKCLDKPEKYCDMCASEYISEYC